MRSIWKTKNKFNIQVAGYNLFMLIFKEDDALEAILKGMSWLFVKNLVLFARFMEPTKTKKIQLYKSPFWLKVDPCPSECDRKDLMHAIGSSFESILGVESKGDFFRIRVTLDVRDPLRRDIFIKSNDACKSWIPFNYEKLLSFCFGCERMAHIFQGCTKVENSIK